MLKILASSALAVCLLIVPAVTPAADMPTSPPSRTFKLEYGASLISLRPGSRLRVWLPVPPSNDHQHVRLQDHRYPISPQINDEPKYGNKILYFEASAPLSGELSFASEYRVTRKELRGVGPAPELEGAGKLSNREKELFLSASSMVPLTGKPLELLSGVPLPSNTLALARELYERVDNHVRYDKSAPGYGNGNVLWVCDSRFGNCTDFHSLFLSLARSQGLPARFEIGFPLPPKRGSGTIAGYHCWAFFHEAAAGWVPVDISEADKNPALRDYYFGNLNSDRVAFSVGRDIELEPRQSGPPLNYFIYPYVEAEGRQLPADQVRLHVNYQDLGSHDDGDG